MWMAIFVVGGRAQYLERQGVERSISLRVFVLEDSPGVCGREGAGGNDA